MGIIDNIRGFFSGSKNAQTEQINDEYEKTILAEKIVELVTRIQKINSFDSSIWNLSNVSRYDLKRKSLDELERLHSNLKNRLSELDAQSKKGNVKRDYLESTKWTGEKPKEMSDHDFDRFQRNDDSAR